MFNIGIMSQLSGGLTKVLELLFNGADNSSVFLDTSSSNHTMTTVGTPTIQSNNGFFNGGGNIYTDTLSAWSDNDYTITGSFSISSWPAGFQNPAIFGYDAPITVNPLGLLIGASGDGANYKKLIFFVYDSVNIEHIIVHQTDITLSTVHTFEVRRSGGFTRLFLDSVEATTPYASGTQTVISNSSRFCVGKGGSTASLFEGTMIELVVYQAS